MGPGAVISITLCLWLVQWTHAGVIRETRDLENYDMPPCLTYTLNSLTYVDCSGQELTEMPDGLDNTANVLLLSNNEFTSFPPQIETFTQLQILDLSENHLSTPLPSYFENMNNLLTLNLSNNNYDVWSDTRAYNFKKLDLSKNKINNIDEAAFNRMPQLRFLDLSENRLHDLPSAFLSTAHNLDTIILSRNHFSRLPKFKSQSLKTLRLDNCQISDLEQNSLAEMSSLLELYLSMNQIETIPDNFASNTLQELDLSYNGISSINDNSFSSLPHLAVLDLRGNDFTEIWSTSHFASNPYLREVQVKGNRWNCEGFHFNLLLTYEFLTKEPQKVGDRESLICYAPANVTQMSWQQAYIRTWHPADDTTVSYTSFAMFLGVIIGVVITSCVCRGLMAVSGNNGVAVRPPPTPLNLNGTTTQPAAETVTLRIPLRDEDLPPSYDEALLMPRLNASFHSLPDFVDEEEEDTARQYRRSRSIGDLTDHRPRTHDRRSIRRTIQINTNTNNGTNDCPPLNT